MNERGRFEIPDEFPDDERSGSVCWTQERQMKENENECDEMQQLRWSKGLVSQPMWMGRGWGWCWCYG